MNQRSPQAPVAMADRVVHIMEVFERSDEMLTLGEISARSGLPRSSTHRILQQLVGARWLRSVDNTYAVGMRMFEIGSLAHQRARLAEIGRAHLYNLAASSKQVAYLTAFDDGDVVYVDTIGTSIAFKSTRLTHRMPAHRTAAGRALLAWAPQAGVERYRTEALRSQALTRATELDELIASVRRLGYAAEDGESLPGVSCVAAPIVSDGALIGAISLGGASEQFSISQHASDVMQSAAAIGRRVSAIPGLTQVS